MKKKMIVAAVLLAAVSLAAFANPVMYVKGALGYSQSPVAFNGSPYSQHLDYRAFTAVPTFGVAPWRAQENKNAFLRGLSFEFSVGLDFGSTYSSAGVGRDTDGMSVYGVKPGIMAVYSRPSGRLIPYGGIGFSIPIAIAPDLKGEAYNYTVTRGDGIYLIYETDSVGVGFNADLMLGIGYAVTENIMPVIEVAGEYYFPFVLDYNYGVFLDFAVRVGCVFKFGG